MTKTNTTRLYESAKQLAKAIKPAKAPAKYIKSDVCSVYDLSTEELGFFTYNGKTINMIFPR